jgi:hypothetical protein
MTVGGTPVAHVDAGWQATPVLFACADATAAHECALFLRHGPKGLPGPGAAAAAGQEPPSGQYQMIRFSTNAVTYY